MSARLTSIRPREVRLQYWLKTGRQYDMYLAQGSPWLGSTMDRVRDILLFFVAGMSVFALICAVYQAMNEKIESGVLLASIFLVGVFVVFLPKLEILEA